MPKEPQKRPSGVRSPPPPPPPLLPPVHERHQRAVALAAPIAQLKAELEHEKRDRKIIVSCLETELSTLRGPKCLDEDCLDYDGEHPYHNNIRVQAWEKAQKELVRPLQEQLATLTAKLAEQEAALVLADEVYSRTAAFVSWLAHSSAVMAPSTLGLLDRINAAEKEYAAARGSLAKPAPPTEGKESCGKSVTGWLRCVLPKGHDGQCSDVKKSGPECITEDCPDYDGEPSKDCHDYYFCIDTDYCEYEFSITPKSYYDEEGCLLDNVFSDEVERTLDDSGFDRMCDSTYQYKKGSVDEGRKVLLFMGLTEKQMNP